MKSRTSCFNWGVFRKDITRFAPAWGLYLVGLMLFILNIVSHSQPSAALSDMDTVTGLMAVMNLCYALVTAQLLFGDLFNTRLCNALHAMPLRREGWFLTHLAAGLCFSVVPNLVVAMLTIPRLDWYWTAAFLWLGAVTLQYLFFFAVAVFCVMCTGNRFAMAVIYGLINFGSLVAYWFAATIYQPLMYGIEISDQGFFEWCPVAQLCVEGWFYNWKESGISLGASWGYLFLLTGVGALLLIVSLVMYRRRKLECAGDFVAVKPLGPIFLVVYTLTMAAVFAWIDDVMFSNEDGVFLFVGLAVGYITGLMLLKRTVRVFRWKSLLGGAAIGAVLVGTMVLAWLDPVGITRYVPEAGQVQSVTISTYGHYYHGVTLEEPENIALVTDLQKKLVTRQDESYHTTRLEMDYVLEDGRVIHRLYYFDPTMYPEQADQIGKILSRAENVLYYTGSWEDYVSDVYMVQADCDGYVAFEAEDARSLMEAVKKDCDAGHMCQSWAFRSEDTAMILYIDIYRGQGYTGCIEIYDDCENALQWLREHGLGDYIDMCQ